MKIIFVIDALRQGGIRTSFLNLINNLDLEKHDVTLYCFHLTDDDIKKIPDKIEIIKSNFLLDLCASTSDELRKKFKLKYVMRKILALACKLFNSDIIYKYIFKTEKRSFEYDIAISYSNNVGDHSLYFGCNKFVIEKIKAKKKIAWVHVDYEKMKLDTKINNKEYLFFDKIFCVSQSSAKTFIRYLPESKKKVEVIYNLLDIDNMIRLSNMNTEDEFSTDVFNFISVMRLDDNKDPLFLIEVANELRNNNVKFYWRVLGDGPLYEKAVKRVEELDLSNFIHLYGYVENPYPYIKKSDCYISTSTFEGYSLSIIEALYFNLIIIAGRYDSINESLNAENGFVIEKKVDDYVETILGVTHDFMVYKNSRKKIIHPNNEILAKIEEVFKIE